MRRFVFVIPWCPELGPRLSLCAFGTTILFPPSTVPRLTKSSSFKFLYSCISGCVHWSVLSALISACSEMPFSDSNLISCSVFWHCLVAYLVHIIFRNVALLSVYVKWMVAHKIGWIPSLFARSVDELTVDRAWSSASICRYALTLACDC